VSAGNSGIEPMAVAPRSGPGTPGIPWTAGVVGVGVGYDEEGRRRLPPWLHESADVWGEEVVVISPVIGEVEEPNPLRAPRLL
jgi:hypothetical protein